jgi:AraC-like DNA-binding protein
MSLQFNELARQSSATPSEQFAATVKFQSDVASNLNMSARTLRRKLREEKTSFRDLVDELRMEIAIRYLRETNLTVEHISGSLGFSDVANFRQAFRRWTKAAPQKFRKMSGETAVSGVKPTRLTSRPRDFHPRALPEPDVNPNHLNIGRVSPALWPKPTFFSAQAVDKRHTHGAHPKLLARFAAGRATRKAHQADS